MKKKLLRPRFRAACIAGVVTGVLFAVVGIAPNIANADPPEDNAAQVCNSALNGTADSDLHLTTDPVGGTTVVAGDEIDATLTWGTAPGDDIWANISVVQICFMVDGVLQESSIFVEKPGVDDGTASATFTVPAEASEVCVHGRVSGAPGPDNLTDSTHKTGQTCFPVGEPECEEGQTGTYPDCVDPSCEEGQLGTYPDCEEPCGVDPSISADDPACGECEQGQTGTYPDCQDPECEEGQLGTYPDCEEPCGVDPSISADDPACGECEQGQTGTYPDCQDPECEEGQLGTYPDCEEPCGVDPSISADDPACGECEQGQTGTYPDCQDPEDACPDVEGMQTDVADCGAEVLPNVVTPNDPATPAAPAPEVEATALPRTGSSTAPMVQVGLGLIALGGVFVARSRKARGVTR